MHHSPTLDRSSPTHRLFRLATLVILAAATPTQAAVFNVTDYGAVGDDSTDNTAAFTACLNTVIAAGGGTMYLPDGVYRGRIVIPPRGGPSWITIEIVNPLFPFLIGGPRGILVEGEKANS